MAEYYTVLKKAVGGLAVDSSDARRAVYEKARSALIGQLKAIDPPLTTSEISRQRLELEEAIRRVEREAGADYASPAPPIDAAEEYEEAPEEPAEIDFDLELDTPPAPKGRQARPAAHQETFHQAVQVAERQQPAPRGERRAAPVPQAKSPGRSGRHEPSFDMRAEPKAGVMRSPSPVGYRADAPDVRAEGGAEGQGRDESRRPSGGRRGGRSRGAAEDMGESRPPRRSRLPSIILTVLILAVLGGLAAFGWSQRDFVADVIASFRAPSEPSIPAASVPEEGTAADTTVRSVGEEAGIPAPLQDKDQTQVPVAAPGAQKAILYEESRAKVGEVVASLEGAVAWKYVASGPNGPVIEAELSIPERGLKLVMSIRKNLDVEMPASHLVEITASADQLPGGGIDAIPRLVMKPAEEQRGQPLVGTPTKVVDGLYWIALSGLRQDAQSNISVMRQSNWFDMPLLYKSGQRAILTFEKGPPGQEAFEKAFAAWGN